MSLPPDWVECSRMACISLVEYPWLHRDYPHRPYCPSCAWKINTANGEGTVLPTAHHGAPEWSRACLPKPGEECRCVYPDKCFCPKDD